MAALFRFYGKLLKVIESKRNGKRMSAAFSHGSYSTTFSSSRNNNSAVVGKDVREYLGNEIEFEGYVKILRGWSGSGGGGKGKEK